MVTLVVVAVEVVDVEFVVTVVVAAVVVVAADVVIEAGYYRLFDTNILAVCSNYLKLMYLLAVKYLTKVLLYHLGQ